MSEPTHEASRLEVERLPREGACPRCGQEKLRAYPVVAETGWLHVVKCQNCLHSVERERWSRLGHIQLLADLV
jgi:transcription elongation factor Elf1